MTICVAVKVHDCLVLAADSATSLVGADAENRSAIINVYAHGNKVFNLVKGLPIAAMTCGMGNIGRSSISSLAKEIRRQLSQPLQDGGIDPDKYTMEEIANRAKKILFDDNYARLEEIPAGEHSLEFIIGGYGANCDDAEVWKVVIANGDCAGPFQQMEGADSFVLWSGQPEALNRLILGYSHGVIDALIEGGLEPDRVAGVEALIREKTGTSLVSPPMPTGDAIALADFLVDVTKRYVHFLDGADTVGGDTDIATVTRYEGFKWIKRKHFYPRELNRETDHV
ncbi:hypothetical protein ACKU27_13845 [Sphingobium yanoikuyae]|uniref:hypothetical protein n=1 Tax=Sphingobium yanoikuyae TaxID=13690 RepID=UPI003B8F5C81